MPSKASPAATLVKTLLPRLKLQTAQFELMGLPPAYEHALADWLSSLPIPLVTGSQPIAELGVSLTADFSRWIWRAAGDTALFIPRMARYLGQVGATQPELDLLSQWGAQWQPNQLGYWLDWQLAGINAGWYLPAPQPLEQIQPLLPAHGDTDVVLNWVAANQVSQTLYVGRSLGAGNPYTQLTLPLPASDEIEKTIYAGVQLFEQLQVALPPRDALGLLMNLEHGDLAVSVWLSEQGVVKAGLQAANPSLSLFLDLCRLAGQSQPEALAALQGILDVAGPASIECQTRANGFMVELGYQLDLTTDL